MSSAFNIPAGFALVPLKSTNAMHYAWMDVYDTNGWNSMQAMWDAVLAVAAVSTPPVDAVPSEPVAKARSHEEIAAAGLGLEYVHSVLRWAACGDVHTPERIASLHTSYRIVDKLVNTAPAAPPMAQAEPEPMFYGRWHHGNGNLCCGTMRYFRADFDTNPAPDVREGIFDWVCTTMNAALDRWREQKRAADRASEGEAQS